MCQRDSYRPPPTSSQPGNCSAGSAPPEQAKRTVLHVTLRGRPHLIPSLGRSSQKWCNMYGGLGKPFKWGHFLQLAYFPELKWVSLLHASQPQVKLGHFKIWLLPHVKRETITFKYSILTEAQALFSTACLCLFVLFSVSESYFFSSDSQAWFPIMILPFLMLPTHVPTVVPDYDWLSFLDLSQ